MHSRRYEGSGDPGWRDYDEDDRYGYATSDRSWRDRDRFDERSTIPGYRSRPHRDYDRNPPQRYGENEADWPKTESSDLYDRTYGTSLGQGVTSSRTEYWPSERASYGYDTSGATDEYGYGYGQHEGPLERIGHRIGHFMRSHFKKPFRGPKGYTRSDERIREDVCDALSSLGEADPSDVEVSVHDGEVSLTGTVPYRHWKHQMEDAAECIPGVKDVINGIRVRKRDFDASRTIEDRPEAVQHGSSSRRHNGNRVSS